MHAKKMVLLGAALSMLATGALASSNNLDAQQRSIIAIAAHTANGDLTALRTDLSDGLGLQSMKSRKFSFNCMPTPVFRAV